MSSKTKKSNIQKYHYCVELVTFWIRLPWSFYKFRATVNNISVKMRINYPIWYRLKQKIFSFLFCVLCTIICLSAGIFRTSFTLHWNLSVGLAAPAAYWIIVRYIKINVFLSCSMIPLMLHLAGHIDVSF